MCFCPSSLTHLPPSPSPSPSPGQVVDIMRVNVDKVLERDQKLSELDDRADALQAGASQFESCAAKLKNKYWWKNCKVGPLASTLELRPARPHVSPRSKYLLLLIFFTDDDHDGNHRSHCGRNNIL